MPTQQQGCCGVVAGVQIGNGDVERGGQPTSNLVPGDMLASLVLADARTRRELVDARLNGQCFLTDADALAGLSQPDTEDTSASRIRSLAA